MARRLSGSLGGGRWLGLAVAEEGRGRRRSLAVVGGPGPDGRADYGLEGMGHMSP